VLSYLLDRPLREIIPQKSAAAVRGSSEVDIMATDMSLERLKIEQTVVTERYCRDSSQWDKMRSFWHPDSTKTSVKITWFNGTIDGHITGSRAMAQKASLSGVKNIIIPVDVNGIPCIVS
jgi:hypothetical protein